MAKPIMLQGTSSHVGKSVLTAALCRIFVQDGWSVTPFKSQNMALNSYVTKTGGEMGRAQVVQAQAAKIEPDVLMNPILLKPTRDAASQVIVLGKPVGNLSAREYHTQYKEKALEVIKGSLHKLNENYEIMVIEGAGSPAEVNLKKNDVVNMCIAKLTNSPVLLIADIDRGGALASIVGTLELLDPDERDLVKGIIINKFRGDITLLQPALDFLEEKTGKPVLGVIPYFKEFKIPEEDSVATEDLVSVKQKNSEQLDVAIIYIPHISNFTDFDALENEKDVTMRYVKKQADLGTPDLIVLPGSKNTIEDLLFLHNSGIAAAVIEANKNGVSVVGICGGFQMLGTKILDPQLTESSLPEIGGLDLLDTITIFEEEKITNQAEATIISKSNLMKNCSQLTVAGYEIHMGRTTLGAGVNPFLKITKRSSQKLEIFDGAEREDGLVWGTYLHGIFDNNDFRRAFLDEIRIKKGWTPLGLPTSSAEVLIEEAYNQLAEVVRNSLDMKKLYEILNSEGI